MYPCAGRGNEIVGGTFFDKLVLSCLFTGVFVLSSVSTFSDSNTLFFLLLTVLSSLEVVEQETSEASAAIAAEARALSGSLNIFVSSVAPLSCGAMASSVVVPPLSFSSFEIEAFDISSHGNVVMGDCANETIRYGGLEYLKPFPET